MQLEPRTIFGIAYQISDPSDTGTYYVQAKVRDALTDELLDTVNLTDKGDQRFRGSSTTPADGNNSGRHITVTVKVYTNSGYTTLSPNYQIEETRYLVRAFSTSFGGGGGYSLTPKQMREALQPLFDTIPKPTSPTKLLGEIKTAIDDISGRKGPDLMPMAGSMADMAKCLSDIKSMQDTFHSLVKGLPKPVPVDFGPTHAILGQLGTTIKENGTPETISQMDNTVALLSETLDKIRTFFDGDMEHIKEQLDKLVNSPIMSLQHKSNESETP